VATSASGDAFNLVVLTQATAQPCGEAIPTRVRVSSVATDAIIQRWIIFSSTSGSMTGIAVAVQRRGMCVVIGSLICYIGVTGRASTEVCIRGC
jgi:hypothetical protein